MIIGYRRKQLVTLPLMWGGIAGLFLLLIYFGILTFANSFAHALQQFSDMWYWISLLVVGFGTQVGLFVYVKKAAKIKVEAGLAGSSVATAGGISATSMVACCLHHVTDVIPILGVSAAAVFLLQFQVLFIIIGVLSNLIGVTIMLKIIQEHSLYNERGILRTILRLNMKKALYVNIILSVIIFLIVLFTSL